MKTGEIIYKSDKLKSIIKNKDIFYLYISILAWAVLTIELVSIIRRINDINYTHIIIYNVIMSCLIVIINIYFFINKKIIKKIEEDKKYLEEKNKNLLEVTDNIRSFKHDFNNIIQAIDGYIYLDDMKSLERYFKTLMGECNHINVIDNINCKIIEDPAICGVLLDKFRIAEKNNIQMNIDLMINLKEVNQKSYIVARILGILLDNAIEATKECEEKIVNFEAIKDIRENKLIIKIENTYKNKDVDINKIFEKNYTTKEGNTGLGLWKIQDILKKDNNLRLYTSKNEEMFKQRLEIY